MLEVQIETKLGELLSGLEAQEYTGLDPSTVRFSPVIVKLSGRDSGSLLAKARRSIVHRSITYLGHRLLPDLWAPKVRLTKCLALSCMANMLNVHSAPSQLRAAKLLFDLKSKKLPENATWSHGFPYEIKGAKLTAETPNLVTTYFCYLAFHYAEQVGFESMPKRLGWRDIANSSLETFPVKFYKNKPFYMYAPNTDYFVHNANLMAVEMGSFLKADGQDVPLEVEGALLHSIDHFERSSAFPYSAPPSLNRLEDNYHTGYVLRSLDRILKSGSFPEHDARIKRLLDRGVKRYLSLFVNDDLVMTNERSFSAHGIAESILFLDRFSGYLTTKEVEKLDRAISLTERRLWSGSSRRYFNQATKLPGVNVFVSDKSNYPRWSQAWMAFAIAQYMSSPRRKML